MSEKVSKQYTFKDGEWIVVGWAEGKMETDREDDKGQKVVVMQPYYQLFVLSPVSSYKDIRPFEVVKLYFDEKKRVSLAASTGVSVELNEVSF